MWTVVPGVLLSLALGSALVPPSLCLLSLPLPDPPFDVCVWQVIGKCIIMCPISNICVCPLTGNLLKWILSYIYIYGAYIIFMTRNLL